MTDFFTVIFQNFCEQIVEEKEERELRVPLPPSFGYQLNESDDEEEEGPPGMMPIKIPTMQKKVRDQLSVAEPKSCIFGSGSTQKKVCSASVSLIKLLVHM